MTLDEQERRLDEADTELLAAALRCWARKTRAPRAVRAAVEQFDRRPSSTTEQVLIDVAEAWAFEKAAPDYVAEALLGHGTRYVLDELARHR